MDIKFNLSESIYLSNRGRRLGFKQHKTLVQEIVMKGLSSSQVLQENHTTDPDAITSFTFTHRALSDVSCLAQFNNLERLDLTFNNLSSLEGLKPCLNLKWLSVKQNKLRSLKGVEGLACLTVLNAGSNMLQSMEEVSGLVRLRALILNDNEIVSICKIDQMKELNTLVLSRNPIRKIGEIIGKANSITKLSLSNCKIEGIDSSIKFCAELRELRLAHNEIRTLPSELARNTKIQNLDLGNNLITRWPDLKILSSLANLKNLNLAGNPVAEKDVIAKKIKKLVPSLQIFNARPIDKVTKNVIAVTDDNASGDIAIRKENTKKPKLNKPANENASDDEENTTSMVLCSEKKSERKPRDMDENTTSTDPNSDEKKSKRKSRDVDETIKKSKKAREDEETVVHFENRNEKREGVEKKKKRKGKGASAVRLLSSEAEFGLGGPSAWDV